MTGTSGRPHSSPFRLSEQHSTEAKVQMAKTLRRSMTRAERVLWHHLRNNQLGASRFRRQQTIRGYIADFYCHQARLVIEVDGSWHLHRADYDQRRDEHLRRLGLRVLRLSNRQVLTDIHATLTLILEAVNVTTHASRTRRLPRRIER